MHKYIIDIIIFGIIKCLNMECFNVKLKCWGKNIKYDLYVYNQYR